MTVGRADANGAGSANAVAPADAGKTSGSTKSAPAEQTGAGRAASKGGDLGSVPKQPGPRAASNPAQTAPLHLGGIDKALVQLVMATNELAAIENNKGQFNKEGYYKAQSRVWEAETNLNKAVKRETARLSGRSSFSPVGYNPADLGAVEERIEFAYAEPGGAAVYVRAAIRENQGDRLPIEISNLSDSRRAQNGELTGAQAEEEERIVKDAVAWVTEPRASDGLNAAEVKAQQSGRLSAFLKGITVQNNHLEKRLVATVIVRCVSNYVDINRKEDWSEIQRISNSEFNDWIAPKSSPKNH
jgi:hypothetical protein